MYHVARHLADQSATTALDVIIDYWFAIFGPCDEIVVDAASAFLSEEFGQTLVTWGTRVRPIAGEAHWQLGKAETHGGCLKYMYTKTAEEFPSYTVKDCLLYTSPSPRDLSTSRMPSSA